MNRADVWSFRLYSVIFYTLLALDCYIDAQNIMWITPTKISVTKLPRIFEDGMGWIPSGDEISSVYMSCLWVCLLVVVSPHALYPFTSLAAAAMYNFAYFSTVMNRFQHKYLLCMLMWVMPFAAHNTRARRLIAIQVGIVYMWTAITKIADGGIFMSGKFLPALLMTLDNHVMMNTVGDTLHLDTMRLWQALSVGTVACEFLLAVLLITNKYPIVAIVLGLSMHAGVEASNVFQIGFFSYYMMLFYILLLPRLCH